MHAWIDELMAKPLRNKPSTEGDDPSSEDASDEGDEDEEVDDTDSSEDGLAQLSAITTNRNISTP